MSRLRVNRQRRRALAAVSRADLRGSWRPAADAFTWAVRLLNISGRHLGGAEGFNAASDEIDALLDQLPFESVRDIACALALLPRHEREPSLLLQDELDRLACEYAWAWSS